MSPSFPCAPGGPSLWHVSVPRSLGRGLVMQDGSHDLGSRALQVGEMSSKTERGRETVLAACGRPSCRRQVVGADDTPCHHGGRHHSPKQKGLHCYSFDRKHIVTLLTGSTLLQLQLEVHCYSFRDPVIGHLRGGIQGGWKGMLVTRVWTSELVTGAVAPRGHPIACRGPWVSRSASILLRSACTARGGHGTSIHESNLRFIVIKTTQPV